MGDLSKTPWNVARNNELCQRKEWKVRDKWNATMVEKLAEEMATFQATLPADASVPPVQQLTVGRGEQVRLNGMRNRSQFNGTVGEVASSDVDGDGFLLVKARVPDANTGSTKKGYR